MRKQQIDLGADQEKNDTGDDCVGARFTRVFLASNGGDYEHERQLKKSEEHIQRTTADLVVEEERTGNGNAHACRAHSGIGKG